MSESNTERWGADPIADAIACAVANFAWFRALTDPYQFQSQSMIFSPASGRVLGEMMARHAYM
jgi:hypothetical protein